MKKMMAGFLAIVMILSLLTGCGGGGTLDDKTTTKAPEQTTQSGSQQETQSGEEESTAEESTEAPKIEIEYPLTDAGSLTWYVKSGIDKHKDYMDVSESPLHRYLKTSTGVDIQWRMVPLGGNDDVDYNLVLQDNPLPNVITGDKLKYEDLFRDEMIYDLTPYLEEYAPDYWAWLHEDENRLKEVQLYTGEIVFFASGAEPLNICSYGPMIRKDWLDECNLEIPYTLDDWEVVLTAFRDKYNLAPFGAPNAMWRELSGLAAGTDAMGGMTLQLFQEDGVIKCAQTQEEWKELIITLNRWFDNGLIDPDVGAMNKAAIMPKLIYGNIGLFISDEAFSSRIPYETSFVDPEAEWIPIPYPVPNKGDAPKYTKYEGMNPDFATVITTSCSEEELITAIKMLNFGYTEYGKNVWCFGEENVSWYYDENGEVQLTDLILNDLNGKTNALNKYSPMNDSIAPSIKTNRYAELRYDEITAEAFELWGGNSEWENYRVPALRYDEDDRERMNDILNAINNFLEPFAAKCIRGEKDILAEWDNMIDELNRLGLQEYMEIAQRAYDHSFKD